MKEPEPPPLPDDLLEYLDAARDPEPTPAAIKDRLFARLVPLIPPGGGGDGGGGASPAGDGGATAATAAAAGALKGKLVVAAVSVMIGAVGGAGMHATFAPPKTVFVTTTVTATVAAAAPTASVADAPSAEVPSPSVEVPVAAPSVSNEGPGPRKSTMRAERILLEAANAAIIRGDHAAAIASLQQHKQTYPRGELAQERDILIAQAQKLKASKESPAPR
jgi:TolA-binding protein